MKRWTAGAALIAMTGLLAPGCGGAGQAATFSTTSVQEFPSTTTAGPAPPPPRAVGAGGNPAPNQSAQARSAPAAHAGAATVGNGPTAPAASPKQMTVTVTPSCVKRNEILTVNIWTVSRAALGLIVGYADGDPHGAMHIDDAREDGTYTWRVLVAPDAPIGKGKVLVSSSNGNESDARDVLFTVASGGKCA